jgi:signal transduction histidine kinase
MPIYPILPLISGIFVSFCGFFVLGKNTKSKLNQIFFFFTLAVAVWLFATFGMFSSKSDEKAIFWDRIVYIGVVFIPTTFYHFVLLFSKIKNQKKLLYLGYFLSLIFLILSRTDYFVSNLYRYSWGVHTQARFFHHTFLALFASYIYLSLSNIYRYYKRSEGIERMQAAYILLVIFIMILNSVAFLPAYNISISPLFSYSLPAIVVLILSFAIVKYHLFEIRVLLTELLVGVMGLILFLQMIFAPTKEWKISTFSIFLLFLIFGYLLIKYTHQEIKRKEELEEAYKRIEALSEMKSEFLRVVNHQLRTPFSIIRGLVSMMSEGEVSPERQKEFIQKLNFSVERLGTILDDILAAQSLVGGMEPPVLLPCQIEEIVKMQVEHFKPQAEAKGIKISFKKPKEPLPITLADQQMIERIVSRLIDNAILYSEKGEVEVSIDLEREDKKEWIKISVKDQGIGLDEKEKENIFKLFYRGEKATSMHPNGSGLGLFIVKNYVEAHRGKIEVKSEGRGKGSTFIVTLPVITEL